MYVQRSFDRGYGAKEIGISQSKAIRIKLKEKFKNFMKAFE